MSENERIPAEVEGVVYPPGAGGGRGGTEELWTLLFTLQPWQHPDGRIEERPLAVWQTELSHERLRELMEDLKSYSVRRFRVYLAEEQEGVDSLRAELLEVLEGPAAESVLNQRAADLQKPVALEDPFFGTFLLDRDVNWYETSAEWKGSSVTLYLSRDGCEDEAALLRLAQALWEQQEQWDRRVRDFTVQELLELKNDSWLDEDEDELSPEQFDERITLETVVVHPGGELEFSFDDGELFWGHVIQVTGTLTDGPTDAGIAG